MSLRTGAVAALGGRPLFETELPAGQLHFPSWERYAAAMRGICEREWYTNHGPLAVEAERRLAEYLGVRNAVCVSNATVGLMMSVKALGLDGTVLVPALSHPATAQALVWAGARPRFCDVEEGGFHASPERVSEALTDSVAAILAVNLWGDVCDVEGLGRLAAERGLPLFFDSAHGFGCTVAGRPLGGFGRLEVFSFHPANLVNTGEGGCVTTDDDELAARLRNIRSSYGAGRPVPVPITSNGRFSEAQASLTLMALDELEANMIRNRGQFDAYAAGIAPIPGLRLLTPARAEQSNHQSAVVFVDQAEFGLSRDQLACALRAERVGAVKPFHSGLHRVPGFTGGERPHTDTACATSLQLPLGAPVTAEAVTAITQCLAAIHESAARLATV